jgi:hypothetical protein
MAALREVLAKFGVQFDSREIDKGNKSIETGISKLKAFGAALAASALVGGLVALTKGVADQVDQLAKQSIALGVSAQSLQELRHAANLSGVATGELDGAIMKLNRNLGEAANGNKILVEAFQKLDVPVKNADGSVRSADEALGQLADSFKNLRNPAERTKLVMDVFGKSGAKLIPMLEQGADGIAKMRAEVAELGAVVGDDFAGAAQEMNDNLARMQLATFGLKTRLANLLVPALSRVAIFAARATAAFARWTDRVKEVLAQSNLMKAALVWLGAGGLMHVLKLAGGFRGLWALFIQGAKILARFALKILLPILLIDELITTFQGGDTLIRRAIDRMFGEGTTQKIVDFFKGALKKAKAFIGDIVTVFKEDGVDELREKFPEVSDGWWDMLQAMKDATKLVTGFITDDWDTAVGRISAFWDMLKIAGEIVATEIGAFFVGTAASIQDAFGAAWNAIVDGAQRALDAIAGVLDKIPGVKQVGRLLGFSDGVSGATAGALEGARAEGGNRSAFEQEAMNTRLALAQRAEAIDRRMTNTNDTTINITVPPGTPANMARNVANASASGVQRSNRANLAAVQRVAPAT